MRAVSTEISPETGAGGFILPNDRVDVILSKRERNPDQPNAGDVAELRYHPVEHPRLAIDQAPKEKDGQTTVVGKTVTLELKPEQAETLARAPSNRTLSLALRSIADVNVASTARTRPAASAATALPSVRFGIPSTMTTQK